MIDYSNYKFLTKDEIQFFIKNGYLHLESIISKQACQDYDKHVIQPALAKHANLIEHDSMTWSMRSNSKLQPFLTQTIDNDDNDDNDDDDGSGIPVGLMVHDKENKEHDCDPIPCQESNWGALFDNERLNGILDELHGCIGTDIDIDIDNTTRNENLEFKHDDVDDNDDNQFIVHNKRQRRRWEYLHPKSVGWIHVRMPQPLNGSNSSNKNELPSNQSFYVPKGEKTWHVDGGHFSPHTLSSPEQSVILLPCIRDVNCNGGNTILLSGSHVHIADKLEGETNGMDYHDLNEYCEELVHQWPTNDIVEAAGSSAGDIWLLHPFLVHSAGRNLRIIDHSQVDDVNSNTDFFRLTFNIGTRWKEQELEVGSTIKKKMDGYESKEDNDSKKLDITMNCSNKSILEWTIFNRERKT